MIVSRVGSRYAKSLLQLSIELNTVEAVYQDISLVRKLCLDNRDFRIMLKSPVIKNDKKKKIFHDIFSGQIGEVPMKFFDIIIRKNREALIFDICQAFVDQYKVFKKISIVNIETAIELSSDNRNSIMAFLKSRTENQIELVENINPSLIGGVILRMNDLQIDASVRSNLIQLERTFSKELYTVKY